MRTIIIEIDAVGLEPLLAVDPLGRQLDHLGDDLLEVALDLVPHVSDRERPARSDAHERAGRSRSGRIREAAQRIGAAVQDHDPRLILGERGVECREGRGFRHRNHAHLALELGGDFRRRRHAGRLPQRPSDRDGAAAAATRATGFSEAVEEAVGAGIGGLPRRAEGGGGRGEQHEGLDRVLAGQPVERHGAGDLRRGDGVERLGRHLGDAPVAQHTRGVEDAVDRPEPPSRLVERGAQGGAGRHVGLQVEHVGAGGLDLLQRGRLGRLRRAADQHEPAGLRAREMQRDAQPDRTGAPGDDVDRRGAACWGAPLPWRVFGAAGTLSDASLE